MPTFHILHAPRQETKDQLFNGVLRINLKPHQIQSGNKNCPNKRPGTKGGGGGLFATITSFHKTVYPHNLERHLKSLIPTGMKVLVLSKQVDCPGAAALPMVLGGRGGARGGHGECAETGQLQPECFSSASKPRLLFPPHPSPAHPLFSQLLKGSKTVTRPKAEASKMPHNGEDKGGLRGWSLIQRPRQRGPDPEPARIRPAAKGRV